MAGRVHEFQSGVFTPKKPVFEADVHRVNDRIFTGPRGAVQRYNVSIAASDVARTPYRGNF
jgi:hypothetical protein